MKPNLKNLGKRIQALRKEQGLTLEKLAYENGLSKGNLSKIEKGLVDPQFMTLVRIAEGLKVPLKELMDL